MTHRKDQPAQLKRRVEYLERLLSAERERSRRAMAIYSDQLAQIVDQRMRIEAAQAALQGVA